MERLRAFPDRRTWIWAVPVVLAVLVTMMLVDQPLTSAAPALSFRLSDEEGLVRIQWDAGAKPVRRAAGGTIEIRDGNQPWHVALTAEELRRGAYEYRRRSGDLEAKLAVSGADGATVEESARFVGPAGESEASRDGLREERDQLAGQVSKLREDVRRTTARNLELENAIRILENRLEIAPPRK